MRSIRAVSALSLVYDGSIAVAMMTARPWLSQTFGIPLPQPPIFADLDAVFLLAIAVGYLIPIRDPERGRGYLWVMGPLLKGLGALAFLLDMTLRGAPRSELLFAAGDGTMALVTWWALATTRAGSAPARTGGVTAARSTGA